MLKIAQCTDSFLPVSDGVGRVANAYARALARRDHEVYVVTPMVNGGYRGRYPFEILDFLAVLKPGSPQQRLSMAALDMHYLARVNDIAFDVVHTHSPGAAGMEAVRLADRRHVPLVGTFHSKYIREYLASEGDEKQAALGRHFALDYFSRCDEIWTVSDEARDLLLENGFSGNIEVFDNGAEREEASAAARERAREAFRLSDAPALLFVGSLERQKNLPRILEAAAILRRRGVAFQLLFAGQGPDERRARELARRLDLLGAVRFLGYLSDESLLGALYAESELCLFPSQSISAGHVVREAAVQGTPSLVIAGSASAALIEGGVNGLTCGDTAESMANAIESYLSSPARMRAMRLKAREMAPSSWDAVIDRVEARYEALAGMDRSALKRKRGFFRKELERVDLTLEKRIMDLIWRFLKQDTQHLYAYPYRRMKRVVTSAPEPHPLPRSTPEAEGISSRAINALIDAISADEAACAQQIMVLKNGRVIAEATWAPYDEHLPHQLYSLSKSITSTAVGMLVDEGQLLLDEKVCDIFFDKAPAIEGRPSRQFTVRHLLNMSTGTFFNEVGTALGADWEKEFLHADVKFPAGTAFEYNSMNTYMLGAIVRRRTGLTLTEYLTPRLFAPLGIEQHDWEICPNGTEKGGWGLYLSAESVAKIGQLYLNGGVWHTPEGDKRLLSEAWIREATRSQIDTPNGEITYGYGYQIWMVERAGAYLFNGAFGQYMLALPECNALAVLFCGTPRLFAQGGVLSFVSAAFDGAQNTPLPPDPRAEKALEITRNGLSARYRRPMYDPLRAPVPFDEIAAKLDGRVYTFPRNIGGLFPMILQSVHNNFTAGVSQIAFTRAEDGLRVEMVEGAYAHRFVLAPSGYTAGVVTQRQDTYEIRSCVQTERLTNGNFALHICVHFIETPYTRLLRLEFADDKLTLLCDESPSVKDASAMLMELAGITHMDVVRTLLPLLRRERLQHTLRTFTIVTVQGSL